jgi:RimJ/RimL family protein N-acetyltransferase
VKRGGREQPSLGKAASTEVKITFRPMLRSDLPLFARWVRVPAVAEWWYEEAEMSDEELFQKMDPRVLGEDKVRPFIFSINGEPAGYIQTYRVDDHADAVAMFKVTRANGIDLFIGEEKWLHRGFGAQVLRGFIRDHIFSDPTVTACMIDPDVRNNIAIRAYEKAGFRRLREEVSPDDGLTYKVMRLDRE